MNLAVIIPALNEERALPRVLAGLREVLGRMSDLQGIDLIVADNGSTDGTARAAVAGGARVIDAPRRGYGSACLAGLAALSAEADAVLFVDADHSIFAEDLGGLLKPLAECEADLVLGTRVPVDGSALTLPQRFGNALACGAIAFLYGYRFHDLSPVRAIRRAALDSLRMQDPAFGWTVEMQLKALRRKLRIQEVAIRYRQRIGESKISGTVWGSIQAGIAILGQIAHYRHEA